MEQWRDACVAVGTLWSYDEALGCSVLQCVAVCCSVLQCRLQFVVVCYSVLQ